VGIEKPRSSSSCPYSPKCAEYKFSEVQVREQRNSKNLRKNNVLKGAKFIADSFGPPTMLRGKEHKRCVLLATRKEDQR
jgi:hypothetical protein